MNMHESKAGRTYRLEFSEEQQQFHLGDCNHEPEPYGWFTIIDNCSDIEFKIFESYVNRIEKEKLTRAYLLGCLAEIEGLIKNLKDYNIIISQSIPTLIRLP